MSNLLSPENIKAAGGGGVLIFVIMYLLKFIKDLLPKSPTPIPAPIIVSNPNDKILDMIAHSIEKLTDRAISTDAKVDVILDKSSEHVLESKESIKTIRDLSGVVDRTHRDMGEVKTHISTLATLYAQGGKA